MKFPLRNGKEWTLPEHKPAEWKESYPTKDVDGELIRARQWLRDNEQRMKTGRGMPKYLGGWIARSPDVRKKMHAPSHNKAKWDKGVKPWLESKTSLAEIEANQSFVAMLSGSEFRAWAESVNGLVKEI